MKRDDRRSLRVLLDILSKSRVECEPASTPTTPGPGISVSKDELVGYLIQSGMMSYATRSTRSSAADNEDESKYTYAIANTGAFRKLARAVASYSPYGFAPDSAFVNSELALALTNFDFGIKFMESLNRLFRTAHGAPKFHNHETMFHGQMGMLLNLFVFDGNGKYTYISEGRTTGSQEVDMYYYETMGSRGCVFEFGVPLKNSRDSICDRMDEKIDQIRKKEYGAVFEKHLFVTDVFYAVVIFMRDHKGVWVASGKYDITTLFG